MLPGDNLLEVAITVESLRQAENLYTRLLGMREVIRESGDKYRDDPQDLRILEREGLRLLLRFGLADPPSTGRIEYIGLRIPEPERVELRERAGQLACYILMDSAEGLLLEDPLGVRWSITTYNFPTPSL